MTPQAQIVLNHLERVGNITPVEASTVYKVRHLPRRIADLKDAGYEIVTQMKKDLAGQRYARYVLQGQWGVTGA